MVSIVQDPEIRSGSPRLEGTRVTVLDIKRQVIDDDVDPFAVAAEYDIQVAAVFEALAYFYANVEEMRERETAQNERRQQLQRQSAQLRTQLEEQGVTEHQ